MVGIVRTGKCHESTLVYMKALERKNFIGLS